MARAWSLTILLGAVNFLPILLLPFFWTQRVPLLAIFAAGVGLTLYALFHPRNQWIVRNRSRVKGEQRVALTFDDGPDPVDTPRLLDLLREKNVKATFFVVGKRARQHPEIVRRAWREGHLIGSHTWSHWPLFCFLPPQRLRDEIEQSAQGIEDICGQRPRIFRSPVGLRHPFLSVFLERSGMDYVSWRVRSYDTLIAAPKELAQRILAQTRAGDIVLFHDRLPGGTNAMLEALPRIIDELRSRGIEFVLAGSREEAGEDRTT